MVPPSADHLYVRLSLLTSSASQAIGDSDRVRTSFSAVRELIMGGSLGGGVGGGGGGGGEQALLKSSAGTSSKMINLGIYFIGDLFRLMRLIVYSCLSFPLAPFPSLANHGGEVRKPLGCTNITVRARAKSTISSESDCKCVNVPNISSHIPKHSQEVNFIFPWLMYQELLAMKAVISGSDRAAMGGGQILQERSMPSDSST